ncbi:MAG: DEAD/DEAH box helicase [Candidatus Pacebacteria bacterium]|nr:DEAD/DEAH box helicase [Candidatus Paceibacterota bacterium]
MKTQLKSTYQKRYLKKGSSSFGFNKPNSDKKKTGLKEVFGSGAIKQEKDGYNKGYKQDRGGSNRGYKSGNGFASKGPRTNNGSFKGNGNRSKKNFREEKIDINRFIQKCSEVTKEDVYVPTNCFNDFNVDSKIKANIAKKGYVTPTPIQDKTIPLAVEGKDVVGIANTGTGKTAAFLIPAIDKCLKNKTKTIIIVPTRELALQIEEEFRGFTYGLRVFSVLCIGGTSVGKQIFSLKKNHDFIIGTPGRIKDMAQRKYIKLADFRTIVLDEVDRMLDMGFIDDISHIISQLPQERQNLFFSATLPAKMDGLVNRFLKDPVKISVKKQEYSPNVNQTVVRIGNGKKYNILCDLLNKQELEKVIIFAKTKVSVEKLSEQLNSNGFNSESIHGDKRQSKREKALSRFKKNQTKILVTTDVAARGLDIQDITHVINYDIPATYDDYVHKIGRTGRGDKRGEAITFVS